MQENHLRTRHPLLILAAGITGAIGSTLCAAVASLPDRPEQVKPFLTTAGRFPYLPLEKTWIAGWDRETRTVPDAIREHGVLPHEMVSRLQTRLEGIPVRPSPPSSMRVEEQVTRIRLDMEGFRKSCPGAFPVLVNLLPAAPPAGLEQCLDLDSVKSCVDIAQFPDMAYVLAALEAGIPVVNFTPNSVEIPAVAAAFAQQRIPLCGRDGKTGQTYFKVVLASAFRARNLTIDGWYSLNILGNADGANLMDPDRCAGKRSNKTDLLDEILGYPVGKGRTDCHKVHIDYYPPRGDAKEAWDVIDFSGLFGLPMSLRLNLQGRDSILAAPMVLDLARWMAAAQLFGRGGLIPDVGFYFKKPMGERPGLTFEDQLRQLREWGDTLSANGGMA